MKTKSWLRLYHEFADDPKIQMLAFEDQRHYVMVLCLKGRGVIDSNTPTAEYRERMIAKALGLDPLTAREVKFRLMEPGLIDDNWQPVKWADRQFESDTSTERVQRYREKKKRFGNVSSKHEPEPEGQLVDRTGNVSVTAQIRSEQSRENSPTGNSLKQQNAPPRAIPSGSRGAKTGKGVEPEPYNEDERRRFWNSTAVNACIDEAAFFGRVPRGTPWDQLPSDIRAVMASKINTTVDWAIEREMQALLPFKNIDDHVRNEVRLEMRVFKPPTPAERAAAHAA